MLTLETNLRTAMEATKCHRCGCFQEAVLGLGTSAVLRSLLPGLFEDAKAHFEPKRYDCLGCEICWPAVASNAAAELDPTIADASHCATAEPVLREGWPPLPGDYSVLRYSAPVAVCTLNSEELAQAVARTAPDGLAIVGTMHTENLGIERVIRNVLANPNIRFLVLCGDDTRQSIGHLPGQSMACLFENGLDERQRIVGAKGKRPFLKNVSAEHVRVFKEQVQLVPMIGEHGIGKIAETVRELHGRGAPAFSGAITDLAVETVRATEPQFYKSDPAGFLVVYPNRQARTLVVEHYSTAGVLGCVVEGATSTAVYGEVVKRGLVSQLDHAAYLGRELATAERSLQTGEPYVQDRAPGEPVPAAVPAVVSDCGPSCTTCH
ncbi:MAG: DUF4346 domain-containing protein [Betaproteobacteria bacterium]